MNQIDILTQFNDKQDYYLSKFKMKHKCTKCFNISKIKQK